jgi:hypothetical protein
MPTNMPGTVAARALPAKPNLEHLKNEAKHRLEMLRAKTPAAKLAEAQHQLAREYGFANWRELKAQVEARSGVQPSAIEQAAIGDWIGKLAGADRMALHIRRDDDGRLAATLDLVNFGHFGMTADDVSIEGDRLSFVVVAPLAQVSHQGLYEGRWDREGGRWIGEWTMHGVTLSLDFGPGVCPPRPSFEGLDGFWDTRIATKDGLIRLILRFRTDRHGTYAWVDSPDRNLRDRPAVSVSREGRSVTVVMQTLKIEGQLSEDGQTIEGALIKGETRTPLALAHRPPGAAPPLPQRAQVIELTLEVLEKVTGRYEAENGPVLEVTVADGGLRYAAPGGEVIGLDGVRRVQAPGGPPLDLLPTSPTKFLFKVLDATGEFESGPDGAVTGLVIRQAGRETRANRIG